MDRRRQLARLWSWLPAFRAAGETESLQEAAKMVGVGASSLSRAVGLLEHELGEALFERVGRSLRLTTAGQEFLGTLREAMRLLDDGVERLTGATLAGAVHVSTAGELVLPFVAPACDRLATAHPEVVPYLYSDPSWDLAAELARGRVDVGLTFAPVSLPCLVVERLGALSNGLYCGVGHPLFDVDAPTQREIKAHPFVVALSNDEHCLVDGWPADVERRISLYVTEVHQAFEICAGGRLLAAIPDFLVALLCSETKMRRLPVVLPPTDLYAMKRRPLRDGARGRADLVIDVVRAEVEAVTQLPSATARPH